MQLLCFMRRSRDATGPPSFLQLSRLFCAFYPPTIRAQPLPCLSQRASSIRRHLRLPLPGRPPQMLTKACGRERCVGVVPLLRFGGARGLEGLLLHRKSTTRCGYTATARPGEPRQSLRWLPLSRRPLSRRRQQGRRDPRRVRALGLTTTYSSMVCLLILLHVFHTSSVPLLCKQGCFMSLLIFLFAKGYNNN